MKRWTVEQIARDNGVSGATVLAAALDDRLGAALLDDV